MTKFERKLTEEKKRLETVKAPKELENRLKKALAQTPNQSKKIVPRWLTAAVALLFLSLAVYQYDALAYYGKKLLGFDELMSGTLAQLNDEGYGQAIDEKVMLPDGSEFVLDGVLTDESQMILYYTIRNADGLKNEVNFFNISGFLTKAAPTSGTYSTNEENTEMKGIQSFEAANPFAKTLTLQLWVEDGEKEMQDVTVSFPYKPNAAMQTQLKQSINKSIQVDQGKIQFNSITVTPTRTTVKGKLKVDNFDRVPGALDGIFLVADGVSFQMIGASNKSSLNGNTLEIYFEPLPKKVDHLKLIVETFVGYADVNKTFSLADLDIPLDLNSEKTLFVRKVEQTEDGLQLTIATVEDVMLDGVTVEVNKSTIPLTTTLRQDYVADENGESFKERILLFETDDMPDALNVKGMHYEKLYGQSIDIDVK